MHRTFLMVLSIYFFHSLPTGLADTSCDAAFLGPGDDDFCNRINTNLNCSTIVITSSQSSSKMIEFTSTCYITIPVLTLVCAPSVILDCSKTGRDASCFELQETISSFSIAGCTLHGTGIVFNAKGNLTILDSSFDGLNNQVPINVYSAGFVFMRNSIVIKGISRSLSIGGGCMSIRGVRGGVILQNVTVRNCSSTRSGGCVYINGDTYIGYDEPVVGFTPLYKYGGAVQLDSCLFEYCYARASAGVLAIMLMNSTEVTNSVFRHGASISYEGCMLVREIGYGRVNITNINIKNCTTPNGITGCLTVALFDAEETLAAPAPLVLQNIELLDCVAPTAAGAT
eukprot:PhF_6_TR25879/c0_g1_i1/m.36587